MKSYEGRVVLEYRFEKLILFSGVEYTKFGWTAIPVGHEVEALAEKDLEVREAPVVEAKKVAVEKKVVHKVVAPKAVVSKKKNDGK